MDTRSKREETDVWRVAMQATPPRSVARQRLMLHAAALKFGPRVFSSPNVVWLSMRDSMVDVQEEFFLSSMEGERRTKDEVVKAFFSLSDTIHVLMLLFGVWCKEFPTLATMFSDFLKRASMDLLSRTVLLVERKKAFASNTMKETVIQSCMEEEEFRRRREEKRRPSPSQKESNNLKRGRQDEGGGRTDRSQADSSKQRKKGQDDGNRGGTKAEGGGDRLATCAVEEEEWDAKRIAARRWMDQDELDDSSG